MVDKKLLIILICWAGVSVFLLYLLYQIHINQLEFLKLVSEMIKP